MKWLPLAIACTLLGCGGPDAQTPPPQNPATPLPAAGGTAAAPVAEQPAPVAEAPAPPAPTLPPRPEGDPCLSWTPAAPKKDAGELVAEVANQGIGTLQETSCTAAAQTPPPCAPDLCEAWVEYLASDALVLYQKFEVSSAMEQALKAVKTGRQCGLTGQTMARAYVALGYILVAAENEMVKASNAFRWAFLQKWDVQLPFPSPPPNVKMTFQAAKASMGPTEFSCVQ